MATTGPQDNITYTLEHADGARAVFNDRTDADYVGMARWSGLDDAEVREVADDRTERDGGVHGNFWKGRRPVVGTIEISATSTTDRNEKVQLMRRASNALRDDATLTFTPDGGVEQFIRVRKNGALRRGDDAGWLAKYSLPLVAEDPLIYSTVLNDEVDAGAAPDSVSCINAGDALAPAVIKITGPATFPVVTNVTTGEEIEIRMAVPSGEYVELDTYARTLVLNGTTNMYGAIAGANGIVANTGLLSPDVATNVAGANVDWTNAGNVFASDDNNATATQAAAASVVTDLLRVTDFDMAIPTDATILGIEFFIEKVASHINSPGGNLVVDNAVTLQGVSGTSENRPDANLWPLTSSSALASSHGAPNDLWGLAPTPAELNATTFGVNIQAAILALTVTVTGYVDHVRCRVTYETAALAPPQWFGLEPGANTITCTEGDLTVSWRDAWL